MSDPTARTARPQRPQRPQTVLTVVRTEWVSSHMVRVFAGGAGFDGFATNAFTDKYIKIFFVDPALRLTPPYDVAALRESLPQEQWPTVRTYTVRSVDPLAGEIAIDFVVHGDEGVAGPWAANAKPGDTVVFGGPGGAYSPDPTADWHVFAGDESALPAIASALEALHPNSLGIAHIEVGTAEDAVRLTVPDNFTVNWLVRDDSADVAVQTGALAAAVEAGPWPNGARVQAFMHGEREAMKSVREVLKNRGIPRDQFSLSGYWARGRSEDAFQAEKREPIGMIAD